jgi:hypothetical protein
MVASLVEHLDWLQCDYPIYHTNGSTGCCIPYNLPCRQPRQLWNIWKFVVRVQQSRNGMVGVMSRSHLRFLHVIAASGTGYNQALVGHASW